jgi:hypothetical protein
MATVKYISIDSDARTVTFDVDGAKVTRNVPSKFSGTIDDYVKALADGLVIEYTTPEVTTIETPTYKANDVVAS